MTQPEVGRIYQGDCIEIMHGWPDKCVDLILTDPPYGVNVKYESYEDSKQNLKKMVIPLIEQCKRISHRTLLTCGITNMYMYPEPDVEPYSCLWKMSISCQRARTYAYKHNSDGNI